MNTGLYIALCVALDAIVGPALIHFAVWIFAVYAALLGGI